MAGIKSRWVCLTAWPVAFAFCMPAASQTESGWKRERSDATTDSVSHGNGSFVKTLLLTPKTKQNERDVARLFASKLAQCPGLVTAPVQATANGRGMMLQSSSGLMECAVVVGQGNGKLAVSVGMQPASDDVGMIRLAEFMAFNRIDHQSAAPPISNKQGSGGNTGTTGANGSTGKAAPTSLKAALDAIPRANRPIGMAFRSEWDSVAMSMSFFPYLLFAGNIALEGDCPTWNPMLSVAQSRPSGCEVVRWTQRGDMIRFDDDDPISAGGFFGFKPGERLNIRMSRQGGGSVGGGFGATSVVSSGEIILTAAGKIDVGSWTGTSTQGSNFIASSNGGRRMSGQYLLDGYLIAIMDNSGNISIGSIAGKIEGRDKYIFLNGEQYWN